MPPNHFESEVESFLEGSHGDRTHIKRADHHTVTPLCGTLLPQRKYFRVHRFKTPLSEDLVGAIERTQHTLSTGFSSWYRIHPPANS